MDIAIINGTLVDYDRVYKANVVIKKGKIHAITNDTEFSCKVVDAKGSLVFPGFIDAHVHFNDPGFTWREDFLHGTKAAAAGGVTTIVDMPLQNTPALTDKAAYENKEQLVSKSAYIDYGFWGGFVNNNISEFEGMKDSGACALKAFMSSAGEDFPYTDNGLIYQAMIKAKELGITLGFHCEDYHITYREEEEMKKNNRVKRKDFLDSRPLIAEIVATRNIIDIAKITGATVHICHVSHPDVAKYIKDAKAEGVNITAETCTHYLIYNENDMIQKGTLLKCAPPLRSKESSEELWKYVLDGTLDLIVSDHSPATFEEKDDDGGKKSVWEVWSGISGVQTSAQIMFSELVVKKGLCPSNISRLMSKRAAEIFGLSDTKGSFNIGSDADFALVDPLKEWEIKEDDLYYVNKISGFCGVKGTGKVIKTIVRGEIVFSDGEVIGEKGYGKLIRRS